MATASRRARLTVGDVSTGTLTASGAVDLKLSNYSTTAAMNGSIASANNATLATAAANYGLKTVVDQHSLDIAARTTPLEVDTKVANSAGRRRVQHARRDQHLRLLGRLDADEQRAGASADFQQARGSSWSGGAHQCELIMINDEALAQTKSLSTQLPLTTNQEEPRLPGDSLQHELHGLVGRRRSPLTTRTSPACSGGLDKEPIRNMADAREDPAPALAASRRRCSRLSPASPAKAFLDGLRVN